MSVLITSTKKNAGKTMVGLGIGQHFPGKVGFFKPLGTNLMFGKDEDVMLFKEVFHLEEDPRVFNLSHDYHGIIHDLTGKDFRKCLKEKYDHLSKGKDFMIIESAHTMTYGSYTGLSAPQVASILGCPGVLVAEGEPETIIDKSIMADHCFKANNAFLLGVIVNRARFGEEVQEEIGERIHVLGVIPENFELGTPTSGDIIDALDGELLAGEEGLSRRVETTVVGAMTYDSAQRTLQHMEFPRNSVMVTGGDSTDMHLLAFEIRSSLLILTGGNYPPMTVLAQADELKIPVAMVTHDTLTAALRCEEATVKLKMSHAPLIKELVGECVDLGQIFEAGK